MGHVADEPGQSSRPRGCQPGERECTLDQGRPVEAQAEITQRLDMLRVAVGGVAVLATAIAMVDIGAGHHGGGQEVHGAAVSFR